VNANAFLDLERQISAPVLPPFDDPLFGQPPNVFLILRELLR